MSTVAPNRPAAERAAPRPAVAPISTGLRLDPIRVLRQNQWKIVVGLFLGSVLGLAAHFVLVQVYPLYNGFVLFELRPAVESPDQIMPTGAPNDDAVERQGQTEATRLTNRTLLEKAVRARDVEATAWAQRFRDASGQFDAAAAVDDLEEDLGAAYRKRTLYFTLSWSTHEKADVPVVLNQIARTYISNKEQSEAERFSQNLVGTESTIQALERELESLRIEIGEFITNRNVTGDSGFATDIVQRMEDTSRRINETKTSLSIAESRRDQTSSKLNGSLEPSQDDVRQAEEDPVLMKLNGSFNDAKVYRESMMNKFGTDHPEFRNADRYAEAARKEHASELKKILNRNLTADLKLYSDQAESYSKLLKDFEDDYAKQELRLKEHTAAYAELELKKDRQQRLQEQRSKHLDLRMNLQTLKAREDARAVRVEQYASTPREMSFPQLKMMVPLGALLGILLTIAFAFLRELLDQRVRYTSDLTGIGSRLLGIVPDVQDDPTGVKRAENAICEAPQSVIAESLRQTTSHLLKFIRQGNHRSILFVGGLPGAGVTAILTNVAESIASSGRRVLVIDADFRRPGLSQAFGVDPAQAGLGDLLLSKGDSKPVSFDAGVRSADQISRAASRVAGTVDFLGSGTLESRVFERLSTPAMDAILAAAKEAYDVVLIDSPPSIVAGDALVLAAKVDATVLVVRAFQEQRGLVARLCAQLNDMPSQLLGVILNRPRNTAGGYFRKNYEAMAGYAKGT
jgi:polysaccharide biosynthesis transport protein